jgi:rhamnulokinase
VGTTTVLAVDIGAESGRVHAVTHEAGRIGQRGLRRFPNRAVEVRGTLHWDVLRLWDEVRAGVRAARDLAPASVGIDTWAVDFALLDERGRLLGNPVHHRDRRTEGAMAALFERIPPDRVFAATGIQFMPINTAVQLMSLVQAADPQLAVAKTFLTIPDLLHHWLTGARACEFSNATTTQLYDAENGSWSSAMLSALGLDVALFPPVVPPGTHLGDFEGLQVVAPASHDTASAVAGLPVRSTDFAYVSSGTWSLVGLETRERHLGPLAMTENVTNEGGVAGTNRLLKNVTGLWIVQQCLRVWREEGLALDYPDLVRAAANAPAFGAAIDVDHPDFLPPGDHPARIRAHCRAAGQPVPGTPGEVVRVVLESLALAYRRALESVERVAGVTAGVIHVVGGGSRNALLCQLTADVTDRPVVAGPVEATVLGNGAVQLLGLGVVGDLAEARRAIARGCRVRHFRPMGDRAAWDAQYARWRAHERHDDGRRRA